MASTSIPQSYLLTIIVIVLAFATNIYCNKKCDDKPKPDKHCCTVNQTCTDCYFDCPNDWCLKDDEPQPVCDPPPEYCNPGCRCKPNYKKDKHGNCILACDCPPIKCTGCNQEYNCCPEECGSEQCEARYDPPVTCNTLLLNCQPKCVCRKGTWRNSKNECVEACDCDDTSIVKNK